jgi:hypothetical protein
MTGFIFHSDVIRVDLGPGKNVEGRVVMSSSKHCSRKRSLSSRRRGDTVSVVVLVLVVVAVISLAIVAIVLRVVTLVVVGRVVSVRRTKEESLYGNSL